MRIGALAGVAGISTKAIRFYEQAGLLPAAPRTASGYRDYPPEAAERLALLRDAQAGGLTLEQIREILVLRDGGRVLSGHEVAAVEGHLRGLEERIAALHRVRSVLRELAAGGARGG